MMDQPSLGNRHSQHAFSQVPSVNMARSRFDRSFAIKDTFDFDKLIPIFCDEILPGDSVNLNVKSFARLATQVRPVMDNMYIDYFFFFVPNRLVWTNWEKFNGAQDNPGDSTSFTVPTITINDGSGFQVGEIYDKFGLPTDVDDITINALPLRAYNLIWNEWFRDQNLQNSITVNVDNGPDAATDYSLQKRGKRHDYFTSCLPWPQKATAVDLPIGTTAPVLGIGRLDQTYPGTSGTVYETDGSATTTYAKWVATHNATNQSAIEEDPNNSGYPNVRADLSNATAATINEFRDAILTQSLYELDARAGTRYTEILRAHFGVISPDQRLQRPEYLSGGSSRITQHPVANTSATATEKQGELAAFSTAMVAGGGIGFSKSFVEHGYVIGLAQARADITYQQGIERMWSRSTRFDYFWPKLQQLGEQTVLMKEIYAQGSTVDTDADGTPNDDEVFGYQERYAEYRYKPSQIKGEFRSTYATPLDVWHMAEEFSSEPALNSTFIQSNTPVDRALAVSGDVHLLFDAWFDYKHARPIMTYGIPATLGRF
jgi:hypothetical protein